MSNNTIYFNPETGCFEGFTPDNNGWVPVEACNANYFYYPSFLAACAFTVLFTFSLGAQIFQAIAYKKLRLSCAIIMCAAWELVGFALRSASTRDQQSNLLFYSSTLFILLAPVWLNAFVYMVLGRMIYFFLPERAIWGIRARRIAVYFVSGDIISFMIQAGGGALLTNSNPIATQMLGIHIYMSGIALQQFIILVFTAFALRFRSRMLSVESEKQQEQLPGLGVSQNMSHLRSWRILLYVLMVALAFISTRIIFRLMEFAYGFDPNNYLAYHEWAFYVFDALVILAALVVMSVVHPGRVLVGPDSEFPKTIWWTKWSKNTDMEKAQQNEVIVEGLKRGPSGSKNQFIVGIDLGPQYFAVLPGLQPF